MDQVVPIAMPLPLPIPSIPHTFFLAGSKNQTLTVIGSGTQSRSDGASSYVTGSMKGNVIWSMTCRRQKHMDIRSHFTKRYTDVIRNHVYTLTHTHLEYDRRCLGGGDLLQLRLTLRPLFLFTLGEGLRLQSRPLLPLRFGLWLTLRLC